MDCATAADCPPDEACQRHAVPSTGKHCASQPKSSCGEDEICETLADGSSDSCIVGDTAQLWWTYKTSDYGFTSPVLSEDGSILYSASMQKFSIENVSDSTLLNFPGKIRAIRTTSSACSTTIATACAVDSDDCFDDEMCSVDRLLWSYTTSSGVLTPPVLSHDGSTVFVASLDANVYALDTSAEATPRQRWTYQTGGWIVGASGSPTVSPDDQTLYINNSMSEKALHALTLHPGPATPNYTPPTGEVTAEGVGVRVCGLRRSYRGAVDPVWAYHFQVTYNEGLSWEWYQRNVNFDDDTNNLGEQCALLSSTSASDKASVAENAGKVARFRAAAVTVGGTSDPSSHTFDVTICRPPCPPTNVRTESRRNGSVLLQWDAIACDGVNNVGDDDPTFRTIEFEITARTSDNIPELIKENRVCTGTNVDAEEVLPNNDAANGMAGLTLQQCNEEVCASTSPGREDCTSDFFVFGSMDNNDAGRCFQVTGLTQNSRCSPQNPDGCCASPNAWIEPTDNASPIWELIKNEAKAGDYRFNTYSIWRNIASASGSRHSTIAAVSEDSMQGTEQMFRVTAVNVCRFANNEGATSPWTIVVKPPDPPSDVSANPIDTTGETVVSWTAAVVSGASSFERFEKFELFTYRHNPSEMSNILTEITEVGPSSRSHTFELARGVRHKFGVKAFNAGFDSQQSLLSSPWRRLRY